MPHDIIKLFERSATLLTLQGNQWDVNDALAELSAWVELSRSKLTDEDMVVLGQIGGVLYREAQRRWAAKPT